MIYKKVGLVIAIVVGMVWIIGCPSKDTEPPEVKITNPANNATVSGVVTVRADARDNEEVVKVEFYIDGEMSCSDSASPWEYEWDTRPLPDSSVHTILAKAYDPSGNMGSSELITVLVRLPNQPPNPPAIPSGPTSGGVGVSYTFSTSTSDPEEDKVAYQFDWGDGSPLSWTSYYPSGDTVSASHSYASEGTYLIKVKAKDTQGGESDWSGEHEIVITANRPPNTPSDPSPPDGATDLTPPITLSWKGGDPDSGDVVKYDVYFGTETSPPKVATDLSETSYTLSEIKYNTKYYWKIVAKDDKGATSEGPVWSFTTSAQPKEIEIKYDDGEREEAWRIVTEQPREVDDDQVGWCMKMTPPSYPFTLTKVKFFFSEVSYDFYLHVYKDEYGEPGRNLLHTPYLINYTDVPWEDWWVHDVSSENVVIESGDFYVGFCYRYIDTEDGLCVAIGADQSPPFDDRAWVNVGEGWSLFSSYGYEYRYDLMIRAVGYIGGVASPRKEVEITGQPVRIFKPKGKIKAKFMAYPIREKK